MTQRVPAKRAALADLGERSLLLPVLVNRGLVANDQAKYLLSLLQMARSHADDPTRQFSSLREERTAAGLADPKLDRVAEESRRAGDRYVIPGAGRIIADLVAMIREMRAPLTEADSEAADETARLDAALAGAPDPDSDEVSAEYLDQIASGRRELGDSLHLLVMDAHRALNRLQARLATASVDGAATYGLTESDRGLVAAFMSGVHETEALRFGHPGLATTATRTGERLLIQNDLGTTSAHVMVLAIEGMSVTLTHTDVHLVRLRFFQSMLDSFAVRWSGTSHRNASASLGGHHLTVGRYLAADREDLESFLRHVGSRVVFVLDWNRARKRLRGFLPADEAIEVLRWAADNNVGHMAFLALGGERLIYDAVEQAAKVPARYGEPLSELLGLDATLAIARFALRSAAEGMLAGKSQLLIRDELRVEVLRLLRESHRGFLGANAEHASLIVEAAQALHRAVIRLGAADDGGFASRAARRAAEWEHRADEILTSQRQVARRARDGAEFAAVTSAADDAIDALEEAIFLLTLLPGAAAEVVRPILEPVAGAAAMTAREYLKAVEAGRQVVDGSTAGDLDDFVIAVDHVAAGEHETDSAERRARAALVRDAPEFRSLYVADAVARGAEEATDALLRASMGLREHILRLLATS